MPYNKELHANLGHVDKRYKDMLSELCSAEKRTIKDELEYVIWKRYVSVVTPGIEKSS